MEEMGQGGVVRLFFSFYYVAFILTLSSYHTPVTMLDALVTCRLQT